MCSIVQKNNLIKSYLMVGFFNLKNMDLDGICKLKKEKHKKYIFLLIIVFVFDYLLFPLPILAKEIARTEKLETFADFKAASEINGVKSASISTIAVAAEVVKDYKVANIKPVKIIKVVKDHGYHHMTAYTSEVAQTDADPCTTANGYNLCKTGVIEDTVAANFLKFGTKVKIPELFGDRIFVVRDRMNSRYPDRLDVWFKSKPAALKFGIRNARVEVVE
jgi:3D (Asp-Asp-Asp) domain-containing protein